MAKTPPFWVAGVVITPTQRSVVLIVLEDSRREVAVATLREGESIEGYRLTAVEPEREGRRAGEIAVSAAAPSDASSGDAPDPEALEKFLGRVFNHPPVERKPQEMRPAIQQSLERARQDGHGSPAPLR